MPFRQLKPKLPPRKGLAKTTIGVAMASGGGAEVDARTFDLNQCQRRYHHHHHHHHHSFVNQLNWTVELPALAPIPFDF